MYKFIKIRHYIIKECHGNYEEMKIFNYEIEIFRNSTQNLSGVLRGSFQVFGCPKRHPDALLAKTMNQTLASGHHSKSKPAGHLLSGCHLDTQRPKHQKVIIV